MKRLAVLLTALFLLTAAAAPVRRNNIYSGKVNLSAADTVIVIDAQAPKTIQFAAQELKAVLDKVFGKPVPIVFSLPAGKKGIFLGVNNISKQAGLNEKELFRDAFFIKNTKKGIFIAGLDDKKADPFREVKNGTWGQLFLRGTLFGVYDWLERFAGVRFYFPMEEGTIIPETEVLSVPEAEIFDFPDFQRRLYSYYDCGVMPGGADSAVSRIPYNLNMYRTRTETCHVPNCHGLARLGYILRFGKTHPEYFALMSNGTRHCDAVAHAGSLCYSSPIAEEIYQDAKSFLKGEPPQIRGAKFRTGRIAWDPSGFQPGYFNIMPQDSFQRCRCKACEAKYENKPNYATEFMWKFVADCGNRLKKEGVPGYLTMMGYYPYKDIPKCDIPDNVLVMIANTGAWGQHNPVQQKKEVENIVRWTKKLKQKVWLWNYMCKFGATAFTGVPSPTPHSLKAWLHAVTPYISGISQESEGDRFLNNYLVYYLLGKYSWNNKVDLDALIAEHNRLMFGNAAPVMEQIQNGFENIWMKEIISRQVETALGPAVVPPSDYDLWHKIYTKEKIAEFKALFDKAEKLAAKDKKVLKRVKLFRSEWLIPLTDARKNYMSLTDSIQRFETTPGKPAWLQPFKNTGKKCAAAKASAVIEGENLHVVFDCDEPEFDKMSAAVRKFDDPEMWSDSSVEFFINPSGDRKVYYQFILNLKNCFADLKHICSGKRGASDIKWNSGAKTAVTRTKKGFKAELWIPLKSLPDFKREGCPVNFCRNRIPKVKMEFETLYTWSPFIRGFHDLESFGMLRFKDTADNNMLDNGDFSKKRSGRCFGKWYGPQTLKGKQQFGLDTSCFFSGPASIKLVNEGGNSMELTQYLKGMKPETEYLLSAEAKLQDVKPLVKGGGVCLNPNAGGNQWFPANALTGSSDNWIHLEFTFKTPKKLGKNDYLRIRIFRATGTVWFDDVKIIEKGKVKK